VDPGTEIKVCSPCLGLHLAVVVVINCRGENRASNFSHCIRGRSQNSAMGKKGSEGQKTSSGWATPS